ncbi:hypothetical protein L3X07_01865 [Levilactobacillus brevis]|nr:hypothetical protein [Levilactobacillus brevis]
MMEAVVFDVDGTLSFNGQVIEAPIVAAIRRLQARGNALFLLRRGQFGICYLLFRHLPISY